MDCLLLRPVGDAKWWKGRVSFNYRNVCPRPTTSKQRREHTAHAQQLQPACNAACTSADAPQKTNMLTAGSARTRRCRGGTFGLGWHVTRMVVVVVEGHRIANWLRMAMDAGGGTPPDPPGTAGGKAGVGRQADPQADRLAGRRRSVGARGGDAHDGAAALRRVRDVRAAARGRGRQRRGRALGNGDAVRRRVPFMSRLAARQAGGAGRGAENIFVLERTNTHTDGRTRILRWVRFHSLRSCN